jgi:hypothetical protein
MGRNAEDRLLKRRINELEQDLKKLKRELDEAKNLKKQIGRLRKKNNQAELAQAEIEDLLKDGGEWVVEKEEEVEHPKQQPHLRCRKEGCKADTVKAIEAGPRIIVVCEKCGSRYTINNK